MPDQPTAETIFNAMQDLRRGKITPDAFRAIMRESREVNGETEHERLKVIALSNFDRAVS
jgi:hypothetical protein